MHKLHSYKGIVLSLRGVGEKNTIVTVLSRGLGRVSAKAISSRESKGKLKGHITPYSFGVYTFVRGKEGWRLIHAEAEKNFANLLPLDKKKLLARVIKLVNQISGESKEVQLFDLLHTSLERLVELDDYLLKTFEAVLIAKILFVLGYLSFEELPEGLKNPNDFSDKLMIEVKHYNKSLVSRINKSLQESQLTKAVY